MLTFAMSECLHVRRGPFSREGDPNSPVGAVLGKAAIVDNLQLPLRHSSADAAILFAKDLSSVTTSIPEPGLPLAAGRRSPLLVAGYSLWEPRKSSYS